MYWEAGGLRRPSLDRRRGCRRSAAPASVERTGPARTDPTQPGSARIGSARAAVAAGRRGWELGGS